MNQDHLQHSEPTPRPVRVRLAQSLEAASLPGALLRMNTVCELLGLSRATVYRLIAAGSFPKPVHVTPRCSRWRSDEVAAWSCKQQGGEK